MRRQARISAGGVLVARSASALQVWLWLLIFIFQNEFRISRSIQPGYLDFDNLPETNFTCAGKVIGGYYADLETSCQMFHVCTVGQQEEPMDIKFLCLNGTVFDQETRVCERVDEVDCTKSEKFYSLNLELYGSTIAPPIIQDDPKPQSTEQSVQQTKTNDESDPSISESTTKHDKTQHSIEVIDSTDDPTQDTRKDEPKPNQNNASNQTPFSGEEDVEEEYQDEIDGVEYEEDYSNAPTTTTVPPPTTTTVTTTTRKPPSSTISSSSTLTHFSPMPHLISSQSPTISSISSSAIPSSSSSASLQRPLDPSLLTPQEFIYHHRGPGSDAISFQRHSYRPADGVYITHAPPQQFDHFQYESSRTAPRPAQPRPSAFVQRPQPAPFRPTTLDPRDQLIRPGPTSLPSERHETSVKHKQQSYSPTTLPAQQPLHFNPYYYDRKRSDHSSSDNGSSLTARSVAPPVVTERPPTKLKSPPRVIVTASASVSDSNGKRLNYTVGNVVSAVKPIVPINYDDYKESDLIFDPFFLDVPKLKQRRKTRSNKNSKVFTVPPTTSVSAELVNKKRPVTTIRSPIMNNKGPVTVFPSISQVTTLDKTSNAVPTTTTISAWNPNDYVDDNYEPQAYVPPEPPLAVLVARDHNKFKNPEKPGKLPDKKFTIDFKSKIRRLEQVRPTWSAGQTSSSQVAGAGTIAPTASLPPPPPFEAYSCATLRSSDCKTRA